jgi:hypothetical protein
MFYTSHVTCHNISEEASEEDWTSSEISRRIKLIRQ